VYRLLVILVFALPFMDLELVRILGRSIVLPVVAAGALGVAILGRPRALLEALGRDRPLPLLVCWMLVMGFATVTGYLTTQRQDVLASNLAQIASFTLMALTYGSCSVALRLQPVERRYRIVQWCVWVGAAGGVLSLYQVASVVYGLPYVEWWRTSTMYYKAYTLNWHGGGSWIAFPRAYGTAPEPTFWGGYLIVALSMALGLLTQFRRLSYAFAALLITAGVCLTFSRAVLFPLGAMMVLWLWFVARRRIPLFVSALVLAGAVGATIWPAFVSERRLMLWEDLSAIERLSAQVTGLRMAADHPFVGTGPGGFEDLIDRYVFVIEGRQNVGFSRFYSFFLIILVSTGLLGMVLFTAFLFEVLRVLHEHLEDSDRRIAAIAASTLFATGAIIVYWIGSPAYNMSFMWFTLALCNALSSAPAD
jgi:O-antigen ligase